MLRISTALCILLLLAGAFGLYRVKYTVHDLREEVHQLESQVLEERESLHVMRAEWAYLNRPERLRHLASKYLHMVPLDGSQLADLGDVPRGDKGYTVAQKKTASYLIPVKSSR